jgi:hypothetical protein
MTGAALNAMSSNPNNHGCTAVQKSEQIMQGTITRSLFVGLALSLAGCASYAPHPLPTQIDLPESVLAIPVNTAQLPFRKPSSHLFNPVDGLDID